LSKLPRSDYPFAIRQQRPGEFAKGALGNSAVLADNAFAFLGREYHITKLASRGAEDPGEVPPRERGDRALG
jgi:hypothetical protein